MMNLITVEGNKWVLAGIGGNFPLMTSDPISLKYEEKIGTLSSTLLISLTIVLAYDCSWIL